jgi:multidrug efflux system membrane fusion protein
MKLQAAYTLTVCAGLALSGCSKNERAAASAPPTVPVSVATVEEKDMPVAIRAIGNVEAMESVVVKSQIAGEIVAVHFREGQDVRQGSLLFEIDPRQARAELARAEGTLARDIAQAKNARAQAQRYERLAKEGVVSSQELEQFTSEATALEAAAEADRATVENARLQLAYTKIRSPISGRTGRLMVDRGNIVKENDIDLVTINQITPINVQFAIPEQQLPEVKQRMNRGLRVEAFLPGEPQSPPVRGELDFIDNAVDPATGTIRLKGKFPNGDRRLWPGQFVDVVLTLSTTSDAIVVPSQAVQTGQQGQYVFIVNQDMTAEIRNVTVRRTVGNESVIESGLKPGERVVTDGQLKLTKGAKVEIKQGSSQPASVSVPAD